MRHAISISLTGNWSPSDFPDGDSFQPYSKTGFSINRDMLIVLESPDLVKEFQEVYNGDWAAGTEWKPKT